VIRYIWARAIRRGLLGGDRRWMTLFAVLGAAKLMKRLAGGREPKTVYSEELKPGQTLVITAVPGEPAS
jgi:hypothetical protein